MAGTRDTVHFYRRNQAPTAVEFRGLSSIEASPDGRAVLLVARPYVGSDRHAVRSRVFALDGSPLTPLFEQGYAYASDMEPVCPPPVFLQSGLAVATPNEVRLYDGRWKRLYRKPHGSWGSMAALGNELVTTDFDGRVQLWAQRGRVDTMKLGHKGHVTLLAGGSIVVVATFDKAVVLQKKKNTGT